MDLRDIDFQAIIEGANLGAVLSGQLVPLNNIGPLRVTYNWLYSALNCDPRDQSPFGWVINKVGSGANVSLSPQERHSGMTVYASVRPDYSYTVQVQAPFSADWITRVAGDETMTLAQQGLLTIALRGLNGSYLSADGSQTGHDGHSGYLFHSNAGSIGPSSSFFVIVNKVHQDIRIPIARTLEEADITAALAAQGATDPKSLTERILSFVR
jgi:hypothetical protein